MTNGTEFSVFARSDDHEQVVFCRDRASGLRAIIALYSTALGPGLGGTRFYPYPSEGDALQDALDLSRSMAYKASLAGLNLGGGKAVIIGDPGRDKSEELLRAYGRFVQSLHGRYQTACDVGTFSEDMDVIARECDYVTGRSVASGGAGDSSVLTALGVYQGMRAAAEQVWGDPSLRLRRVGVAGVGKVGRHLVRHLLEDGAQVIVTDVNSAAVQAVLASHPEVEVAESNERLLSAELDVYAPCALGGAISDVTARRLTAKVICGAANNQLVHPGVADTLEARGILYAPDFCVNAGGLIQVADELEGFSFERAKDRAAAIYTTTRHIFDVAAHEHVTSAVAADRIAERRMAAAGHPGTIWLG